MSEGSDFVSDKLRAEIAAEARYRCGYCLRSQELLGMPLTLDHIVPQAMGGKTIRENLWLACHRCNGFKGIQTHGLDPITQEQIALFNPRSQNWLGHFGWSEDITEIIGKTAIGRATVLALKLNNPEIVVARRLWVAAGWWPPQD